MNLYRTIRLNESKGQTKQMTELNAKYKDILRFPITAIKVKDYYTGDQKNGKYHYQYNAVLKPRNCSTLSENIYTTSLEELENKLKNKMNY